MSKKIKRPIGIIYETKKVKTFWDTLKEWIAIGGGFTVFLWIMSYAGG